MKSIIKLFKAVPIVEKKRVENGSLLAQTLPKGFLFSPEVIYNYSEEELKQLIPVIETEIGLTGEQLNASFHKSWDKVKNAPLFQLWLEQIFHYITTYGYEELGVYDKDSVYIPNEKLNIPEIKEGIVLTVIKGYTKDELKEKLLCLLNQGVALSEDTVKDVVEVAIFVGIQKQDVEQIRNKETKVILYDHLSMVPESPLEFLRFVLYKAIGKTLLIKNMETINAIKAVKIPGLRCSNEMNQKMIAVVKLFYAYKNTYGLEKLASIFHRFKPLFLAFKVYGLESVINRIRKLADRYHEPLQSDFLNSVTSLLKQGKIISEGEMNEHLSKVNPFRKIRLAYALKYRIKNSDSIMYKIRNGKGYATDFVFSNGQVEEVYNIVRKSIVEDLRRNIEGKKVFIPKNIVYAVPATEKQFTGDFPSGTYVTVPKDMVVGVHWENKDSIKIDLDLSLVNLSRKIGWDKHYRTEDILFSGDLTDAPLPRGASELFYVSGQGENSYIMYLNFYNYDYSVSSEMGSIEIPYKILIAESPREKLKYEEKRGVGMWSKENYTVDPNDVICTTKAKIKNKQKMLGLIKVYPNECRFYFAETMIGKSITSGRAEYSPHVFKYIDNFYTDTIDLNTLLVDAGAILTSIKEEVDIDLSYETLEKDTIIRLFRS